MIRLSYNETLHMIKDYDFLIKIIKATGEKLIIKEWWDRYYLIFFWL